MMLTALFFLPRLHDRCRFKYETETYPESQDAALAISEIFRDHLSQSLKLSQEETKSIKILAVAPGSVNIFIEFFQVVINK